MSLLAPQRLPRSWTSRFAAAIFPSAPKRIRILVRQSPDWRGTPYAELVEGSRAFCRFIDWPENFIADCVALWDRTFAVPFFEVRAAMKDLAEKNLADVRQASVDTLELFEHAAANRTWDFVDDTIYLFTDDDDWFHPQFYDELKPFLSETADGYLFGSIKCSSVAELRPFEVCHTNNYAASVRYLQRLGNAQSISQHWIAERALVRSDFERHFAPRYLAATNKHPCASCTLRRELKQPTSECLTEIVARYVGSGEEVYAPEALWTRPYLKEAKAYFANLL